MKGLMARWTLCGLIAWTVLPSIGWADTSSLEAVTQTEHVAVTAVAERSVIAPGERLSVLLQQKIRHGWHTYWLNPGDSGQPTLITWHLPAGAHAEPIQWPVPERISVGPLVNYGYADSVALISDIVVPADWPLGQSFPIRADVTWLVCADVCIPESGSFSLSVPTGTTSVSAAPVALFAAARARQPVSSPWQTTISGHDGLVTLRVGLPASEASRITDAQFFPADWGVIDHAAKQRFALVDGALAITVAKGDLPTPAATSGIVTLTENAGDSAVHMAVSFSTTARPLAAPAATTSIEMPLIAILLSALAGGVLLNLMPCVFPVLAMKALALVGYAGEAARKRVVGGVAYTAGILVSFATLGGLLLALKAGGRVVGWGFQLQSPVLVALLAYVLFMAGLSLSGMFEMSGRFMGVGSALVARRSGAVGSFFTGCLAAIVATPCTAPFMATALGVALTQSATIAMATFLVLGLGLALPYLALSLFPIFARVLPRPGGWMNTLKQILAFPLYASAAWLVWVLAQEAGADGVFAVLLGMVAIAFAIWLWRLQSRSGPARTLRAAVCSAVLLGSVILAVTVVHQKATRAGTLAANDLSEPFSRVELDRLRARGKPVFINLTAAWCITCQVNERVALSGEGFRAALKAGGFAYLKGDWTRQNPEITRILESFGRAGVPLYVVFPPNGGQAIVLPQVLTESIVVEALRLSTPTSIAMSGDSICDPGFWQRAERCSYLQ